MFKSVLKPADVESHILNYVPRAIEHHVPEQVLPFLKDQKDAQGEPFILSQITADQTGLSEMEKQNFHDKVEAVVLQRLKDLQEKAYAEAYALGFADGQKKAFTESNQEIQTALEKLNGIGETLTHVKTDMVIKNEEHIVKTLFYVAKSLALREIVADETSILEVLKKAVESAQGEEEIIIRVNPVDQAFLEKVKSDSGNPLNRIPKVKIEVNENVSRGGCIVETNYGVIDATVEQRVSKLWSVLESKIPKVHTGE